MLYNTFGPILNGYEVSDESDAIEFALQFPWYEAEKPIEQNIGYARHVDTINNIGVYYDFGADYYFFTLETDYDLLTAER